MELPPRTRTLLTATWEDSLVLADWRPSSYLHTIPKISAAAEPKTAAVSSASACSKLQDILDDPRQLTSSSCASASCVHRLPGVCGVNHGRYPARHDPFNFLSYQPLTGPASGRCMVYITTRRSQTWPSAAKQCRACAHHGSLRGCWLHPLEKEKDLAVALSHICLHLLFSAEGLGVLVLFLSGVLPL